MRGFSTTLMVRVSAPRMASCSPAPSILGCCGISPAVHAGTRATRLCTSPTSPMLRAPCSWIFVPCSGMRSCAKKSACRYRFCRKFVPALAASAMCVQRVLWQKSRLLVFSATSKLHSLARPPLKRAKLKTLMAQACSCCLIPVKSRAGRTMDCSPPWLFSAKGKSRSTH